MEVQEQTTAAPVAEAQTNAPEQAPQITELDGLSKFSFQGKEYTPEDWHKISSEYETLSKQASEWKKEKEFADNLEIDLQNVLERPELASRFKATYPKKYHALLDRFLEKNGQVASQNTPAQAQALPKEFLSEFDQLKERLTWHEKRAYEAEVQAANAKLDSTLPPLFKKYEFAVEDQVYARAEALLQKGQQLTEKTWERLVRESHEQMEKRANQVYSAKVKTQIEKGQQGKDGGPGGAAPGQAPKRRSFEDATEAMIAHVRGQAG